MAVRLRPRRTPLTVAGQNGLRPGRSTQDRSEYPSYSLGLCVTQIDRRLARVGVVGRLRCHRTIMRAVAP